MEKIVLNVEGMDCSNCALSITKKLKSYGLDDANVNFTTGEAAFTVKDRALLPEVIQGIQKLGYRVKDDSREEDKPFFTLERKFWFCLFFTLPLFLHMFLPVHFLHRPLVQFLLCLPVFAVGIIHFGRSAWGSIRAGLPNMDVLIIIGATAAFIYSLYGTMWMTNGDQNSKYLFYETAATIITLVLLGNLLEHRSVKQTTTAITELSSLQQVKAKKIITVSGAEKFEEVDSLQLISGDIVQVNDGDRVPADAEIIDGSAHLDESMITGESDPCFRTKGSTVIGGTVVTSGHIRARITKVGQDSVLAGIIRLVKDAQRDKPSIQRLGDKVSAVFVPVVLAISMLTFILAYVVFNMPVTSAMMNSIAVLVISCPCAMGLATPTAVIAGIGRAAQNGILIKGGRTLEELAGIKTIVFDKTGTLTTGDFKIKEIHCDEGTDKKEIIDIVYGLEHSSSHPIAKALVKELNEKASLTLLNNVVEIKGRGIKGNMNGNEYFAGTVLELSDRISSVYSVIYVYKNGKRIGYVIMEDEMKADAAEVIMVLKQEGINIVMLSGDQKYKCDEVAQQLKIEEVYSECSPAKKLELIDELLKRGPLAMVGDGINDAPALTKATIGISMGNATQVAMQSAQVLLLDRSRLGKIRDAVMISRHTLKTIRQNLFWAFFYNVLAIPVAAFGMLNPMIAALAMAFSDVIVIGNSLRLKTKQLK